MEAWEHCFYIIKGTSSTAAGKRWIIFPWPCSLKQNSRLLLEGAVHTLSRVFPINQSIISQSSRQSGQFFRSSYTGDSNLWQVDIKVNIHIYYLQLKRVERIGKTCLFLLSLKSKLSIPPFCMCICIAYVCMYVFVRACPMCSCVCFCAQRPEIDTGVFLLHLLSITF